MSSTFFVDNSRTGGGAEEASQMLFPGLSREQLAERLVAAEVRLVLLVFFSFFFIINW